MKIGLQIPSFTWQGGTEAIRSKLVEIANTADELGFTSLWVMDHLFQIQYVGQPDEPMLEAYCALNYMAAVTKRIRLGALVTAAVYRHPGMLVKSVSTLDVLSGGRAYLGIGAAWNETEARGLGIPFPPLKERFERLEETLQITHLMWSGKRSKFSGKHFSLEDSLNSPQPLSKPHPPILIGGSGEKKTLRLVAQYADACNLFARMGSEYLATKIEVLKRHCENAGRDFNQIERTALSTINLSAGNHTVKQIAADCRELAKVGIQHVIFNMPNVSEIKPLEIIGRELIPELASL